MKFIKGGVTAAKGFFATGVSCGLKKKHKLDFGMIYSKVPALAAATFTTNQVRAAAVLWNVAKLRRSARAQAVIANSGCANACTGQQGMRNAEASVRAAAAKLFLTRDDLLIASTGVIGRQLAMDKILKGIGLAGGLLSKDGHLGFARAILTTDLVPKEIAVEFTVGGKKVRIGGCSKGAGMVCPRMALHATILGFLTTDADLALPLLKKALWEAVGVSFNSLTVDGDSSTNDTVFLLANGASGAPKIAKEGRDYRAFADALRAVCVELAKMMAKDGEGATKLITVNVKRAKTAADARKAAFAIANSPLVKTAFYGQDANWGRILCAAGYSGASFDPEKLSIHINGKALVRDGHGLKLTEKQENAMMKPKEILLDVDLGAGKHGSTVYTCDMTHKYIDINAKYRT